MGAVRTDKLVVLARGLGTRMRHRDDSAWLEDEQAAVAETGVKALIPIDRPFLDYVLSAAAEAGCRRVCLASTTGMRRVAVWRWSHDIAAAVSHERQRSEDP